MSVLKPAAKSSGDNPGESADRVQNDPPGYEDISNKKEEAINEKEEKGEKESDENVEETIEEEEVEEEEEEQKQNVKKQEVEVVEEENYNSCCFSAYVPVVPKVKFDGQVKVNNMPPNAKTVQAMAEGKIHYMNLIIDSYPCANKSSRTFTFSETLQNVFHPRQFHFTKVIILL